LEKAYTQCAGQAREFKTLFNLFITITFVLITSIIIVIYVQIHTEDGRRICRTMFVKLKNVVLVIKFTTSLLLYRPFKNKSMLTEYANLPKSQNIDPHKSIR